MSLQGAGAADPEVAVVGSLNLDLVVRVARLPGPGETVSGDDVFRNPGGKGANQAVAAARLGRRVAMVGRVGDDDAGRELLGSLEADATAARAAGGTVVLNPAPVRDLPEELLAEVDVLVPNRVELAQLAGGAEPGTVAEATRLAGRLPARAVVVTLGADGCLVIVGGDTVHVPAVPVRAVDTTAAGDAFCGGLADALAGGATLEDAARRAVRVAAAACLRPGAQASLPTPGDLQALPERAGP